MVSEELIRLSNDILKTLEEEDKQYDFRNGGMYREKTKAKHYQR